MSEIKKEELKQVDYVLINNILTAINTTCLRHDLSQYLDNAEINIIRYALNKLKEPTAPTPDFKLKAMQGLLLDGQANVIKELEDKLEQVKLALLVEENDNQYNCAERDKLKAENARLREKNQRLMQAITFKQNECLEKLNEALAKYEDMKR